MSKVSRVKISDGDMVIISVGGDEMNQSDIYHIRENFKKWLVARGLTNVELGVMQGIGEKGLNVTVLSVNDVFDDTVLNERTKQEA